MLRRHPVREMRGVVRHVEVVPPRLPVPVPEQVVERRVARTDVLALDDVAQRVLLLRASEFLQLRVLEPPGELVRGLQVLRPGSARHREDRKQRADADGLVAAPRVLHVAQLPVQALDLLRLERKHPVRLRVRRYVVLIGEGVRHNQVPCVPPERLHEQHLRPAVRDVEVPRVAHAGEPFGLPDLLPPRRAVARARRPLDVAERLRQERPVPPLPLPYRRKLAYRKPQDVRGEVRARPLRHELRVPPVVHHELQPRGPHRWIPADALVPRLEVIARRSPRHQGDGPPVFLEHQTNDIPGPVGLAHVVVLPLQLAKPLGLAYHALTHSYVHLRSLPALWRGKCSIS